MYINLVRVFVNYYNVHLLTGFRGIREWTFRLRIVDGRSIILESRLSPNGCRTVIDYHKVYDIPSGVDIDDYRNNWERANDACVLMKNVYRGIVQSYKLEYE